MGGTLYSNMEYDKSKKTVPWRGACIVDGKRIRTKRFSTDREAALALNILLKSKGFPPRNIQMLQKSDEPSSAEFGMNLAAESNIWGKPEQTSLSVNQAKRQRSASPFSLKQEKRKRSASPRDS